MTVRTLGGCLFILNFETRIELFRTKILSAIEFRELHELVLEVKGPNLFTLTKEIITRSKEW